jgi:hypothetical protein
MFTKPLPRFVITKSLASGATAFYFNIPILYRKLGCSIPNEPLGTDYTIACGENGEAGRAAALNALFDEWNTKRKGGTVESGRGVRYGTVDWLFREYLKSEACRERVSERTRPDYERIMQLVCEVVTKKGDKIGDRSIRSITPRAADRFMRLSSMDRGANDFGKAKRSSQFAGMRGASCTGSIPNCSARSYRIPGRA